MSRTYRKLTSWDFDSEKGARDCKKYHKPPGNFKKYLKKSRRAKERMAFKMDKEIIPEFPNEDQWSWN